MVPFGRHPGGAITPPVNWYHMAANQHLPKKLAAELPGILNWVLKGCRDWCKARLRPPKSVMASVEEYRDEMDILGHWISENCLTTPQASIRARWAYCNYNKWAVEGGLRPMTEAAFGRRLGERGYLKKRDCQGNIYAGFDLRPAQLDLTSRGM